MPFDATSFIMGQRSIDPNAEYYTKAQMDVLLAQKQNNLSIATGTIGTNATTVTVNYSNDFIGAFAKQDNNIIQCDIVVNDSSVVFTLANKPSSQVICSVVYG